MEKSRNKLRGKLFFIIAAFIISVFSSLSLSLNVSAYEGEERFEEAKVLSITDGDTIKVNLNGVTEKVRLILIDTPECVDPRKEVEFYSREASEFARKEISGRTVWLEKDVSERDQYGRLLRYVWLEKPESDEPDIEEFLEKCFNAKSVSEGYASIMTYPPDIKYEEFILELQGQARENERGLWNPDAESLAAESRETEKKKEYSVNPETATKTVNIKNGNTYVADVTQGVIKGNKKSKIYHMPGQRDYDNISIKNTVYFSSEEEAEAAGYRKSKR